MEISADWLRILIGFAAGGLFALTVEWACHVIRAKHERDEHDRWMNGRQA